MSGGVGPTYKDISLPKEQEQDQYHDDDEVLNQNDDVNPVASALSPYPQKGQTLKTARKANYISFWQLNALAVMIVLSASGMVSPQDLAFVLFSIVYMFFISIFAFPTLSDPSKEPPAFNPQNKITQLGILFGALIGLVLPIAYIFHGVLEGDQEGIRAAAPHVFLLASQAFVDAVAFSDRFSTPIRVFVPVFYNSKRIFTLVDWVRNEFNKEGVEENGGSATARRLCIGRGLAIVNLIFWSFDLFGIILPIYLPRAFKKYYSAKID